MTLIYEVDKISDGEFIKHMRDFYNITLTNEEISKIIEDVDESS